MKINLLLILALLAFASTGCDKDEVEKEVENLARRINRVENASEKAEKSNTKETAEKKEAKKDKKKRKDKNPESEQKPVGVVIADARDTEEIGEESLPAENTRPENPNQIASKESPASPKSPEFSNFGQLPSDAKQKLKLERGKGKNKDTISISSSSPMDHTMGLVMRTTPLNKRNDNKNAVSKFYLDKGVYSDWKFVGSKGSDTLHFGPQGAIINKRRGGVADFGKDDKKDTFIFENQINLERKPDHHPLNHLQKVVIKNFGKEDEIIIQGKKYGYADIKNNLLPGIGPDRLQVFKISE